MYIYTQTYIYFFRWPNIFHNVFTQNFMKMTKQKNAVTK